MASAASTGRLAGVMHGRRRRLAPYLLLAPGLAWLIVFFVVPMYYLANTSLQKGSLEVGYTFSWAWSNYSNAITTYHAQLFRSLEYAGIATLIALLVSYPLAYWIAFRGGRWKNLLLLLVIAPFFVTYLIRTLAWETILADDGTVVSILRSIGVLGPQGRVLATSGAVIAGITYNFLPFMVLPLYVSLEQVDGRLLDAAHDLYASRVRSFLRVTLPLS
ncbi:MAG: spermidine/putrescine transport system permease protein, partial [Solirubrobacteraceae bacterium]|nr:spermidine/putrescine transport system permease protein [Solirubrobacteraceae bacterium]